MGQVPPAYGTPAPGRSAMRYVARLAAHALYRTACAPWVRAACGLDEPACARNFATRGYRHHTRGLDTPPCCRARLLVVLEEVTTALTGAGVSWFAFWGTFLGAVRHGGLIPWDRDADLVVPARDRACALDAVAALCDPSRRRQPRALVAPPGGGADVVRVQASARNAIGVDLEFWSEDGSTWVHREPPREARFATADLFPLVPRPFEHLVLPTPAGTRALQIHYGEDCLTHGFRRDQRLGDPWVRLPVRR